MARVGEEFPPECPACGGDIRLITVITEPGLPPNDRRQEPAHFEPESFYEQAQRPDNVRHWIQILPDDPWGDTAGLEVRRQRSSHWLFHICLQCQRTAGLDPHLRAVP
jgi:hypothetical protein